MLDQITSTLGVLLDVDWQHNFKSFYETVRVKILCKDPSKIPAKRLFGVGNKIYRLLIEVESLTPTETGTSTNLSAGTYVSAAETGTNLTEDVESNRSSRSESDKGRAANSGAPNIRGQSFGHNQMLGETTPTQVLKTHLPNSPYTPQLSIQEKILNSVLDETDGFNLLREMELLEDDDLMELEGSVDLQEDQEALVETTELPDNLDSKYNSDFPALPKEKHLPKWGPVQATRTSARVAGDKRTIIEKAQQLKEVQNLEVQKPQGMKHTSFSNFNDPSFNAIAAKIGVDVTSLNDAIECSSFIYPHQNRSEGSVCENFSLDGSSSLDCLR